MDRERACHGPRPWLISFSLYLLRVIGIALFTDLQVGRRDVLCLNR